MVKSSAAAEKITYFIPGYLMLLVLVPALGT
jgi:hypothetical protein